MTSLFIYILNAIAKKELEWVWVVLYLEQVCERLTCSFTDQDLSLSLTKSVIFFIEERDVLSSGLLAI